MASLKVAQDFGWRLRLLEKGLLEEVSGAEAREGDLGFYFNADGRFKHAGCGRPAAAV